MTTRSPDLDDRVTVQPTKAEALVLFEWIVRCDEAGLSSFNDPAEQTVVWRVEGMLEQAVVEIFGGYGEAVIAARGLINGNEPPSSGT